jgi:hypothetical protein
LRCGVGLVGGESAPGGSPSDVALAGVVVKGAATMVGGSLSAPTAVGGRLAILSTSVPERRVLSVVGDGMEAIDMSR